MQKPIRKRTYFPRKRALVKRSKKLRTQRVTEYRKGEKEKKKNTAKRQYKNMNIIRKEAHKNEEVKRPNDEYFI